jgi:hypothetical protein
VKFALLLLFLLAPQPKATVYVFTRTDCPISNRYAPEVKRIYDRYAGPSMEFILVYPDRDLTPEAREKHRVEYGYPMGAIGDPKHELVRKTGARVTPEAAVFVGSHLVYRGRIDDRYVDFGQSRATPSKHDLADVLAAIQAGQVPPFEETKAIGCAIDDLR